ncbi:hypothetical protein COO20_23615 [Thalassospira marina]|uniref:Uncharacterized protein n=1 Tax=Thalassospira marina TaxID=2048283 RepID=A0A2N3KES3_9PROT|nr:hypothetical protein COO20_23615 [Thalassospira marina]
MKFGLIHKAGQARHHRKRPCLYFCLNIVVMRVVVPVNCNRRFRDGAARSRSGINVITVYIDRADLSGVHPVRR